MVDSELMSYLCRGLAIRAIGDWHPGREGRASSTGSLVPCMSLSSVDSIPSFCFLCSIVVPLFLYRITLAECTGTLLCGVCHEGPGALLGVRVMA